MDNNSGRILRNFIGGILTVLITVLSFFTIINLTFSLLYIKTNVKGYSMLPTINSNVESANINGDTIYINKYVEPNVNDIVVAKPHWYENHIIKRLVGKPGDTIEIKDLNTEYGLFVNDELLYTKDKYDNNLNFNIGLNQYFELYNNFLESEKFKKNVITNDDGKKLIKLNNNEYFLMGDNWGHTLDSLSRGPISKEEFVGKVDLLIDIKDDSIVESIKYFYKKLFSKN